MSVHIQRYLLMRRLLAASLKLLNLSLKTHKKDHFDHDHDYTRKRKHEEHPYCKIEIPERRSRIETDPNIVPSTSSAPQSIENLTSCNLPSTSGCGNEPSENHSFTRDGVIPSTPKFSVRKRRVVSKKHALSPNCKRLYCEYVKSRKQLEFSRRSRRAMRFSKEKTFEKLTRNMNPLAKKRMWMQIKQCTKKAKGRRFSDEEKLIALSIMKQSPKCYKFLHKIFTLPSKYTLNKMIAELNIEAGINTEIFEAVKKEVNNWDEKINIAQLCFMK